MKQEGFYNTQPKIQKLTFRHEGNFDVHFEDGRVLSVPISHFSDIQKLTHTQLKKWYILDDYGFSFDDCDEVYHIEQLLGNFDNYKYSFVNEPTVKYKTTKSKKLKKHKNSSINSV